MAKEAMNDPAARFVVDWLKRSGIDQNMVISYTLNKQHGQPATIDIRMFVQDPVPASGGPIRPEQINISAMRSDETCTVPNCTTHRPR